MEHTEYQQIMDRLEGRILCYGNIAAKVKAGPKQYTRAQMEHAKMKAMQEARIIARLFKLRCDTVQKSITLKKSSLTEEEMILISTLPKIENSIQLIHTP